MERAACIASFALIGLVLAGLLACGAGEGPGAGARSDGGCPEMLVCSSARPRGLYFAGTNAPDADPTVHLSPVFAVAPGGLETVTLLDDDTGATTFPLPYVATTDDETLLRVEGLHGPAVAVRGVAEGTANLRIFEPDGIHLYDELGIVVETPTRLARVVAPLDRGLVYAVPLMREAPDGGASSAGISFLARTHAQLALLSYGASHLVVDESASIDASVPSTMLAPLTVDLDVGAATAVDLALTTAGGARISATIPVVSSVDAVLAAPALGSRTHVAADVVCFSASTGAHPVISNGWMFDIGGPATYAPVLAQNGCIHVLGRGEGTVTVTATLGGVSAMASLYVHGSPVGLAHPPPPPPRLPGIAPTPGHLAGSL